MSRVVKIEKVGKSTIIEIIDSGQTTEVLMLNQLTNVSLRNDCISIHSAESKCFVQYSEIQDKLSSTDIKDYLHKAAAIFLFNQ